MLAATGAGVSFDHPVHAGVAHSPNIDAWNPAGYPTRPTPAK
ncbi:MAG: DUF6295 family protein [Acidimicrobiales bacterium]